MHPEDGKPDLLKMSPHEALLHVSKLSQSEGEQTAVLIADWLVVPHRPISTLEAETAIRILREFPTAKTVMALQSLLNNPSIQTLVLQDAIEIAERLAFAGIEVRPLISSFETKLTHPLPPDLTRAWLALLLQVAGKDPSDLVAIVEENPNDILLWNLLQSHPSNQADIVVELLRNADPDIAKMALQVAEHRRERTVLLRAKQMVVGLQALPISLVKELVQAHAFQLLEQALNRGLISGAELEKILPTNNALPKQQRAALRRIEKSLASIRRGPL